MKRRRFLAISAAMLAARPVAARTLRWNGVALGAEVGLTLKGDPVAAEGALEGTRAILAEVERSFSLYDPSSTLSALNRTGRLAATPDLMAKLLAITDQLHEQTGGVFDPSVQSRWMSLARGQALNRNARWTDMRRQGEAIRLAPGQTLTFNGIAQGFATDLVSAHLRRSGFSETLVNIGEFRAGEGQWRVGLEDPLFGHLGTRSLSNRAIATSSPAAQTIGESGVPHILHPGDPTLRPLWSTVSVEAPTAAIADGLSTAMCFMTRGEITGALAEGCRVTLVSDNGDVTRIG